MSIVQDLHDRLRAALPPQVPVLLPHQFREPLDAAPLDAQGRPMVGGGERGLGLYLRQHPQGYVQVEAPLPISSDGLTALYWVAVASIAPTPEAAAALALLVRRALSGTPRSPGPHREVTPAQPAVLAPGAWLVRPTYDALTLDGAHVAAPQE